MARAGTLAFLIYISCLVHENALGATSTFSLEPEQPRFSVNGIWVTSDYQQLPQNTTKLGEGGLKFGPDGIIYELQNPPSNPMLFDGPYQPAFANPAYAKYWTQQDGSWSMKDGQLYLTLNNFYGASKCVSTDLSLTKILLTCTDYDIVTNGGNPDWDKPTGGFTLTWIKVAD